MGKKLQWFKTDADGTLADQRILSLSWSAKGVFFIMLSFLRTQTDTPGCFIIDGDNLSRNDIERAMKAYQSRGGGQTEGLRKGIGSVMEARLIRLSEEGFYYSRRIVQDHATSEAAEKGGRATQYKSVERPAERPVRLDKNKKRIREEHSIAERFECGQVDDGMVSLIRETLTKIGGVVESSKSHEELTRYVPQEIIHAALSDTQLATRDGQNNRERPVIRNPVAYFWARAIHLATEENVDLPEKWRK